MRRSTPLAFLSLLACLVLGSPAVAGEKLNIVPQGPGAVFDSIEAAAVDGLAFAHQVQLESRNKRLSRGGAVVAVANGYTYGALDTARPVAPDTVLLRMPKHAVAHFHTYPAQNTSTDWMNEKHSKADRILVNSRDSMHRPSYVLTPSLRILGYYGRAADEAAASKQAEALIAVLAEPTDSHRVAAAN